MIEPRYYQLLRHYEGRFDEHGATYRGMDWPNEEDLAKRFDVMLDVARSDQKNPVSILDLGCGVGLLLDHLQAKAAVEMEYWGIDLSERMIAEARQRHPQQRFETRDVLLDPIDPKCVDYVVMNGLLTERTTLSEKAMESFARDVIEAAFTACRCGIAFNVMSTHVAWTRDDLFHWPLDRVAAFLVESCSRSLVFRMDYGLYEYTAYVYREAHR